MFKLEAVNCKNCGSGLVVEVNDNIVYCSSCGSGFEIIGDEMIPVEINFANPAFRDNAETVYKPFWYIKSHVDILERTSSGGFLSKVFGAKNENSFDIKFYIPAFYCTIESMKALSQAFTAKNPVASPQKYNVKLTGFAYGKEDAKKLCEFILISFEAEKKDTVKTFKYQINYESFEILGIPFYNKGNGAFKDAILGIEFRV